MLAELSHPGVVRYITHGVTSAGELFLTMEWVDGEVLKTRLERSPLTLGESITLATRVAEALGAAHTRGIVHRDLEPSNWILPGGRVDRVKVLDFGIARREGRTQLTQTGMMLGTAGHMAPEQARTGGSAQDVSRASGRDLQPLPLIASQEVGGEQRRQPGHSRSRRPSPRGFSVLWHTSTSLG